ncbi:hypothetical protein [Agrobacterium cavarae]
MRDDDLAGAVRRDDCFATRGLDRCPQGVAVIGFIGQDSLALLAI